MDAIAISAIVGSVMVVACPVFCASTSFRGIFQPMKANALKKLESWMLKMMPLSLFMAFGVPVPICLLIPQLESGAFRKLALACVILFSMGFIALFWISFQTLKTVRSELFRRETVLPEKDS